MSKKKPYTIEFESTHNQWIVVNDQIRSHDPDANYGYYYHKTDAKKVADMLNQRFDLLALAERLAETVKLCHDCKWDVLKHELIHLMTGLESEAKEAIAKGGE